MQKKSVPPRSRDTYLLCYRQYWYPQTFSGFQDYCSKWFCSPSLNLLPNFLKIRCYAFLCLVEERQLWISWLLNSDCSSPDTCFPIKPWSCQMWRFSLNVSVQLVSDCCVHKHFTSVLMGVFCVCKYWCQGSNFTRVIQTLCVLLCNLAWTIL